MHADFAIFSAKTSSELAAIELECRVLLDEWLLAHLDADEPFVDFRIGGEIPDEAQVRTMCVTASGARAAPDSTEVAQACALLAEVRSVLTIEDPQEPATSPVLVSVLRFLVERAAPGLIRFGEAVQTTDQAFARLMKQTHAPDFGRHPDGARAVRGGHRIVTVTPTTTHHMAEIDVPRLLIDRLLSDGLIVLDEDEPRDRLEKALDRAMVSEEELSPVKAMIEVLLDHDAVAEVFGSDTQLEASMRRALQDAR